jgi:hypothetical protein
MSTATQVRRPPVVSRRFGYTVGATVNAVLLLVLNGTPGWEAVPFLTGDATRVLVLVNLSLVAGVLVNAARVLYDPRWFVFLGDAASTAVGAAALVRIWQVFPFRFAAAPVDSAVVARVVLLIAFVGSIIGIVVALVRMLHAVATGDR